MTTVSVSKQCEQQQHALCRAVMLANDGTIEWKCTCDCHDPNRLTIESLTALADRCDNSGLVCMTPGQVRALVAQLKAKDEALERAARALAIRCDYHHLELRSGWMHQLTTRVVRCRLSRVEVDALAAIRAARGQS